MSKFSVKEIDSSQFENNVLNSNLPVAVMFYSDECFICENFNHIFQKSREHNSARMNFYKVSETLNKELSKKLNLKKFPTVIFFEKGLEVCNRLIGNITFKELQSMIDNIIGSKCCAQRKDIVKADLLILGAGPAGLTAGIYSSRSRLYTVIVDTAISGGQVANTYHIANYPGTNGTVRGMELVENMKSQALEFGANVDEFQNITEVVLTKDKKIIKTLDKEYHAKVVIIATGAEPRSLPVENESDFRGRGIHYCANCDGAFYQDAEIMVVGGGVSALEESLFLTRYAKSITIINKNNLFKAPKLYIDEVLSHPKISVKYNSTITQLNGKDFLQSVIIKDSTENKSYEQPIEGIFVYIGLSPNSKSFENIIELTPYGYIKTDEKLMTSIPGVFAAGDVLDKNIRQISTAVGDGTIAAIMAERFLSS